MFTLLIKECVTNENGQKYFGTVKLTISDDVGVTSVVDNEEEVIDFLEKENVELSLVNSYEKGGEGSENWPAQADAFMQAIRNGEEILPLE